MLQNVEKQNIELQYVKKQNDELQNVEKQNVELQKVKLQNIKLQNVEWTKCRMLQKVEKRSKIEFFSIKYTWCFFSGGLPFAFFSVKQRAAFQLSLFE